MPSIFSRIIAGELPCYKVYEDEHYFAFLDIRPVVKGHTLVIPKNEVDYIFDLDSEEYIGLMLVAKKIAKALKSVVSCSRIGVAVVGLEVPHTHVHLMPINAVSDMNFKNLPLSMSEEEFSALADKIRSSI
ncbi:MAG: HIT domain-containing protein [Saprospiraceae bacterium]|nr:HIT domain-containing protein [Saprospiraceae bacterium]